MAANANQQDGEVRAHRLWVDIADKMIRGTRDPEEVARVLQLIKDKPDFILELKLKKGGSSGVASSDPVFSRDMRKEGWTLLENTSGRIKSVDGLDLVSFLKKGENSINGEEMVRRARQELNANLGQEDAEWFLEHQNEIPKEWRKHYLTFPGTVWRDSDGRRHVACLRWDVGRWHLSFYWLDCGWGDRARLLTVRKS